MRPLRYSAYSMSVRVRWEPVDQNGFGSMNHDLVRTAMKSSLLIPKIKEVISDVWDESMSWQKMMTEHRERGFKPMD